MVERIVLLFLWFVYENECYHAGEQYENTHKESDQYDTHIYIYI